LLIKKWALVVLGVWEKHAIADPRSDGVGPCDRRQLQPHAVCGQLLLWSPHRPANVC